MILRMKFGSDEQDDLFDIFFFSNNQAKNVRKAIKYPKCLFYKQCGLTILTILIILHLKLSNNKESENRKLNFWRKKFVRQNQPKSAKNCEKEA